MTKKTEAPDQPKGQDDLDSFYSSPEVANNHPVAPPAKAPKKAATTVPVAIGPGDFQAVVGLSVQAADLKIVYGKLVAIGDRLTNLEATLEGGLEALRGDILSHLTEKLDVVEVALKSLYQLFEARVQTPHSPSLPTPLGTLAPKDQILAVLREADEKVQVATLAPLLERCGVEIQRADLPAMLYEMVRDNLIASDRIHIWIP